MSHRLPSSAALRVVPPAPGQGQVLDFPKGDAPSGVVSSPAGGIEEMAIEDLYKRFAPYVAAIASRILGRENEVEDVVQDVFMAALSGLKKRDQILQAKSWFATVTVRSSMRKLRVRSLWNVFDLAEPPNYERLSDPSAGPEERRLIAEVYRALDRCSAKERVAWVLRYVQGESLEDTAQLCDCSLATAKRRIAAAQAVVKKRLEGGAHGA
jgi:RNA polymerase sigma-70 factor, ECF subfamily